MILHNLALDIGGNTHGVVEVAEASPTFVGLRAKALVLCSKSSLQPELSPAGSSILLPPNIVITETYSLKLANNLVLFQL